MMSVVSAQWLLINFKYLFSLQTCQIVKVKFYCFEMMSSLAILKGESLN